MGLAKTTRLNRIFSNSDGRILSVAVDHFAGLTMPDGLRDVPKTIALLMEAKPDAFTMVKGMAKSAWEPYAGSVPLILQAHIVRSDDRVERTTTAEEALLLGADAVAVSFGVRGPNESMQLRMLAETVTEAARFDMPVVTHIYPRDYSGPSARVMTDHESILWAVRCGVEFGADVIKVPFTGDPAGFGEIVESSPVPVVCAGGPKTETFDDALEMMQKVVDSGARGAVVGRNIWGMEDPLGTLRAFQAIVHPDGQ